MSGLMITLHESFTRFCCRDSFSQTTFMPKIEKLLVRDWCQVEQLLMFSIKFFIVDESLGYKVYLYREVSVSVSTPKASSVNELSARLFTFSFRQSKTSLRHESFSTLRRCLKMSGILFSMPNDNCCFYIFLIRKSPKRNADRNSRHATWIIKLTRHFGLLRIHLINIGGFNKTWQPIVNCIDFFWITSWVNSRCHQTP